MHKSRDFIYMDVLDINGEKLGYIKDILLSFHDKKILGFSVTPYKFLKKEFNVMKEDIVYYNKSMIVKKINKNKFLKFNDIKKMYVIDKNSQVVGVVKEIVFNKETFSLKGVMVSKNISSLLKEREVLIAKNLILGEKNILYIEENKKFKFVCVPNIKYKKQHNVLQI
ncbi:MAG: PRC-barrel domain-containing protein [Clostridium sp.]